jgi:pyruvate/2-oxoglutarate dehydrogenase complex dihydrolipoamide dehydrogenase (E3) component
MNQPEHFDAIVIGAGQAGPSLAARLADAGWRVALVERDRFGGTCVNTGCIPTKALIASAHAAHQARRAAEFGLSIPSVSVDFAAVMARKDRISGASSRSVEQWVRGLPHTTVIQGHARFVGPKAVRVGERELHAERIFINVGARAAIPTIEGADAVPLLTSESILALKELPEHLLVVGGSYIGLEFAQMFRRFGSKVTVLERAAQLVPREDADVADAVKTLLEGEDIAVHLATTEGLALSMQGRQVRARTRSAGKPLELLASHVLVATGRRPNTDDLGLAAAGVRTDARGFIEVDDTLETSVPGIWALGEVNGRGSFTHTAYNDFEIVAANLLDKEQRRVSERIDTYALFTDPPLARVGLSVAQARASGRPMLIGERPMRRVGRAVQKGEEFGFIRVLVDAQTGQLAGATLLGVEADEAIHALTTLMYAKAPYTVMQRAVHIHPTVSELLPTVLGQLRPLE